MAVELGKVYFIKTCNEPFFVIARRQVPPENVKDFVLDAEVFSGYEVVGRTPKLTEQGVQHVLQVFLEEEIQSAEDREQAEMDSREKMMQAMRPKGPRAVSSIIDADFIPN